MTGASSRDGSAVALVSNSGMGVPTGNGTTAQDYETVHGAQYPAPPPRPRPAPPPPHTAATDMTAVLQLDSLPSPTAFYLSPCVVRAWQAEAAARAGLPCRMPAPAGRHSMLPCLVHAVQAALRPDLSQQPPHSAAASDDHVHVVLLVSALCMLLADCDTSGYIHGYPCVLHSTG